jgi:hypothetical protein
MFKFIVQGISRGGPRITASNWRPMRLFKNRGSIIIIFPPYARVNLNNDIFVILFVFVKSLIFFT